MNPMNASDKPVFVLTTSKLCGGCIKFKNNTWPSLKEELIKQGRVQIVEIDLPTLNMNINKAHLDKHHKDMSRFIGWFPTMSLFKASDFYNQDNELFGVIKNGQITGNENSERVIQVGNANDLSKKSILDWVNVALNNDPLFARGQSNDLKLVEGKYKVPTSGHYFKPSSL